MSGSLAFGTKGIDVAIAETTAGQRAMTALQPGTAPSTAVMHQSFTGALLRTVGGKLTEAPISPFDILKTPFDGTDCTAWLTTLLSRGGDIWLPDGDYLIASAGPDSGGVNVVLTKSTRIRCGSGARFFTNAPGLDNDMIRFTVPPNGAGLPAKGIDFSWTGGIFDQAQQKGSTSMPFMAEFPSPNPGASATCDGLSIRGDYQDLNGATQAGIRRCIVKDAVFDAGAHWQTAGGDGGLFIGGVRKARVEGNTFKGCRDVGFYASASDDGAVGGNYVVRNNDFLHCFHGVAMKRGVMGFNISDNYGEGCVRMVTIDYIVASAYGGSVRNNTGKKCHVVARVDQGRNITVKDNLSIEAGAFLADGVTPVAVISPYIVVLQGAQDCIVAHNNSTGIHPTVAANYPSSGYAYAVSNAQDDATIKAQNNRLINNRATGWRGLGVDQGINTTLEDNELIGGTVPQFLLGGTGAYEVRVSQATRRRDYSHGINFYDGSAANVAVGRRGSDNHGMYFGTNLIGFAIAGTAQFIIDNRGVRLPLLATYPDDTAAKAGGMVSGNLYRTGDGTLRVVD